MFDNFITLGEITKQPSLAEECFNAI